MKKNIILSVKKLILIYLWFLFLPVAYTYKVLRFFLLMVKKIFVTANRVISRF